MAADDLSFPSSDTLDDPHAAYTTSLLASSYATTPNHDAAHIARVVRSVVAEAGQTTTASASRRTRRWWLGAAAAAAVVLTVTKPWRQDRSASLPPSATTAVAATDAGSTIVGRTTEQPDGAVQFEFTLPDTVRAVALVGDFNGWDTDATPMVRSRGGTWSARVPLEPGRHEYAFVIDGERWVVDPLAPQVPDAGFGPTNAVVIDAEGAP